MKFVAAVAFVLAPLSSAEESQDSIEKDYSGELPRIAPLPPEEALASFEVQPGYHIEQVAAEPLVRDPVALDFDENGRLFVVEMRGYSEEFEAGISSVRMLTDENGDGTFDSSSTYVDGLKWPVAVACYDGGIFVGEPPRIFYAKDADGDGKADIQEDVYTGFSLSNVQGLMNSFTWGLDNKFYAAASSAGGDIVPANDPNARPLGLHGRDFAFDPRTREIVATSGGAQHGLSFDDWGRRFLCHNSDHIQLVMFEDRYVARNPYLETPSPRVSIAADGPAGDVFRISPIEPWRIVRTRLRVKGLVPGPIEGGGTPAGYFTSATGITIYTGDAMPELKGMAIIGDVGSNLIHRKKLEADGVSLVARRMDDQTEFIRSKDIWFRPVQFGNAPDGTLYVLDMYREVIEHPASLPPLIKQHLDLNSGNDRGRIYRIVPEGFVQPAPQRLGEATAEQLVQALDSPNGWIRRTAARLLYQRQDQSAVPQLDALAAAGTPEGKLRALYALDGLDALRPEALMQALRDSAPQVRVHALILSEPLLKDRPEILNQVASLVEDTDQRVRYQLAFSLGEAPNQPPRNEALAALARREAGNAWFRLAILSSLTTGAAEVLALLADAPAYRQSEAGAAFLEDLALQAGAAGQDLDGVLAKVDMLPEAEETLAQATVRGLLRGLKLSGQGAGAQEALAKSQRAAALLNGLLADAHAKAVDGQAPADQRADAISSLAFDQYAVVAEVLPPLMQAIQPTEVQSAALGTLRQFPEEAVGEVLLKEWDQYSPETRSGVIEALFSRKPWLQRLLQAMADGQFAPKNLESTRIQALLNHPDETIQQQAKQLLASYQPGKRTEVVETYQDVLTMPGDAARGRELFTANCNQCHKLEERGFAVGPDLANIGNSGPEKILVNVLDPNREINPQYINYTVETKDWESHSGIIASETATSVTLKRGLGETSTLLRVNIESIRSEELSIMPEGWEETLGKQGLADIIAYLMSLVQ
ncbi:MAG: c-type cytochrome [Candidatus Hydrogenedentes bacterium]|nr:c-type cytochrome [Candidatus Hydrogenedentota bacterium]